MDEQRLESYIKLLEQLLNCSEGQEVNLLLTQIDLVDAGFLLVIEQVAVYLEGQGNNGAAEWLREFSGQLHQWIEGQANEEGTNRWLQAIKDSNYVIRGRAAEALGKLGGKNAIIGLLQALEDPSSYVRKRAVRALGRLGNDTAVAELKKALEDRDYDGVSGDAVEALVEIGSDSAIEELLGVLTDKDSCAQSTVAETLGRICLDNLEIIDILTSLLCERNEHEVAIVLLKNALHFHPNSVELYVRQGNLYSKSDSHEETVSSFNQALITQPNSTNTWSYFDDVSAVPKRYEEAIASYDKALAIQPDLAEVWNNRGVILAELGQYEEAIASYDQAIVFQPDLSRAWDNRGVALDKLGRHEEAIESYDQALHYKPDDHLVWYNKGNALCGLGRYEEAIESCDRAIQLKPDYPEAWHNRGEILSALGRSQEAIDSYNKAIQLKPDFSEAWHNRGNTLSYLGRYEEAMASYDKAIQFKPDLAEAWHNRGLVLSYLDRYEEALSSYNKTLELKPDFAQVWSNRGEVLRELQQFNDSLANFNRAVELQPDYIEAIANRGETYQLLKRYEEALVDFNLAIELEPDYVWAIGQRGEIYRLMKRHEEAVQDFTHALELEPNNSWVLAQRGQALASINRYEAARRDYEQALAIYREKSDLKNEAICLSNLGNTYACQDLSESQQAIEYFQRALDISQDIDDVRNRAIVLDSLGRVHASIEEHSLAIEYYQQALDLYKVVGDRFNESLVLLDLADAYQVLENYQQSIDFYEQALAISQELDDLESAVLAQSKLTQALLQVGDFERAIEVAQSISDQEKQLEVLTGVVEEARRLGREQAEELLLKLYSYSDEKVRQLVTQELELRSREESIRIPNNLPVTTEKFVGRARELKELHNILQEDRFAVITGVGGIGKTELCKQYASTYMQNYSGGICWLWASDPTTPILSQILKFIQAQIDTSPILRSSSDPPFVSKENSVNILNKEEAFANLAEAEVVQDISQKSRGRVKFRASYWSADCLYDSNIQAGESVFVTGRRGITLLVIRKNYWLWNIWSNDNILIILDDVNTYDQIRPYLPPKETQFKVIITTRQTSQNLGFLYRLSRSKLREDRIMSLPSLTVEESVELLGQYLSRERIELEQKAVQEISEWLAFQPLALNLAGSYLQSNPEITLENMFLQLQREQIRSDQFISTKALATYDQIQFNFFEVPSVTYSIALTSQLDRVPLGYELSITIDLSSCISSSNTNAYLIEISHSESIGNELNILVVADGFRVEGDSAISLPLDPAANTQETSQTASFRLTALRPGINTITAEIYRGDTFETTLQTTVQVTAPEESELPDIGIKAQPRPVSQPDLVLQVQTQWDETASTSTFHYQLRSFRNTLLLSRGVSYTSQPLPRSWLEQIQDLLAVHLQTLSGSLPEDGYSQLVSLGQYLFQSLFPIELQTDLRTLNRYQSITLLLQTDQEAQFPWSLLHNGQEFLGERFIIGQWLWDLNNHRPHEFPVGAINLAHYANVEQPETWATLLEPPGAPPPFILPGGMLEADLSSIEAMRGLHLLRFGQSLEEIDRQDAPVPLDASGTIQDLEQKVRPVKLNLRRNRPLVTLGYLRQDQPELTSLEKTWAPTFLRAGCSAFVGSLWAVSPETEAAFVSTFYHALWKGDSLGGAFQTARKVARATLPESIDWLAYVLFGDPMARPYRPIQGQGYAVVEPIGQEIDDPVSPGTTVRFRVSLRRTPPVWHEERVIEVAENLSFNDLQAHIVTFGLQITPATSVSLSVTPSGNYIGWFNLTVPPDLTGESTLVQVYFADGMQTIHTLTFPLKIAQAAGG